MSSLLLLSGGMDSVALAFGLRPEHCLTINYGQLPAAGEIRAAQAVCNNLGLNHHVLNIDCRSLGAGDLVGEAPSRHSETPEWWPFRNQLIITIGAAFAIKNEISTLIIGAVSTDRDRHSDGRPQFFQGLGELLRLQEGNIHLSYPAINLTTAALCDQFRVPIEFLAWAHSCHVSQFACGVCRGCLKHRSCMSELGFGKY